MHDRYSQLSRKFAQVEGERQKLMMTLKNVKACRKAMLLNFHHHLAANKFSSGSEFIGSLNLSSIRSSTIASRQRRVTWKDTSSTIDLASHAAVRSLEEWFSGRWKRVLLLRFSEATRRKVSRGKSSQSEPCCRCVVEPYIPSSKWNLLVHRRFVLHTLEAGGKEFCFYGSRRQRAGRFHEDRVVKVNLVVGPHFIHSVLCLAKDQDLAFSGKLTKLGCVPLGVAAGGWFVLIMVQKGSVVSAGSALNHLVAKLSSSCSGCNDLSSLRCKVDVSAFMPYPRDVWIMKRSFWSGCEVVVLSYEWGWYHPVVKNNDGESVKASSCREKEMRWR
ncbi:hypothetical protein F2Q70_00040346 [Brassica cretica]|uniref:Uncharacterized protein n=1 Tax=Brassica cretica TaxID=69181 RepID=A0A8S9KB87_BRACR|nr:hypothetical protein F2Q70_00040346 [Brassica cretica]